MTQIANLGIPLPGEPVLPDGRRPSQVSHGELNTILERFNIVGFSHSNGRAVNEALYAAHLNHIAAVAGQEAIERWLAQNRS